MPVQPSYLTCTAAQASEFNKAHRHEYLSLNQLLECRAASHPDIRIAGFPELRNGRWELFELTFASLLSVSNTIALHLLKNTSLQARVPGDKSKRIVALLSPSCVELLVTLFAALRLGYGVLLLAPQNLAEANSHLCRVTEATHLICHSSLVQHGAQAAQGLMDTEIIEMPAREVWRSSPAAGPLIGVAMSPEEEMNLPALVMHTSGSTGMPKPIYQSHRVWTQAIPCMPGSPAFTTTPLFHGGSADFLRSINALSTLYLFSSLYPITVTNVVGAVEACHDATAFLSVPYILKMLAESTKGLEMLQRMDLVSTGGAPLPPSLGDDMVRHGVKLVSRLGSSECGFLMSSHRDYENDKEWSWLRNDNVCEDLLRFEPVPDSADMYELIVGKEWSTRVVSNRDDESFASGDLYSKHPAIASAWRYAGRVDDMIVMTNGKKASANPIESALRACPEISEAIVFGASRPALGVIIVRAAVAVPNEDVLARVHLVNQTVPTYASVQDELVIVLPPDADLPKTSKGSVVRPRALQQYAEMIDKAYNRLEEGGEAIGFCEELQGEEQVKDFIYNSVKNVMKHHSRTVIKLPIGDNDDLFNAGVDSLQASVIQRTLQKAVGPEKILPSNVVFEYPSITKLSKYIASVLFGSAPSITPSSDEHDHKVMRDLVARFTAPFTQVQRPAVGDGIAIVTGATGSLGAHVLYKLLSTTRYRVVALLRAADNEDARRRVLQNLERRKLHIADADASRLVAFASNLEQDRLGLPQSTYETLLNDVQVIFHAAWPVNFAYSLESFVPILKGTQTLLALASSAVAPARIIFCSSIAAASHPPTPPSPNSPATIHETLPTSESCAAPLGYARAKWVAEHMCDRASKTILPGGRVKVARVGQLCGDTEHGVWSESEAWPLLVASTKYTGRLPYFESRISLLPVDVAASALLDIASSQDGGNLIYHVTTSYPLPWPAFLAGLERAGLTYKRLPAHTWVAMMESRSAELDMPTRSLLGLWKENFGHQDRVQSEPVYDTTYARGTSEAMRTVQTVSDELIAKFVARWKESGFLSI